ncbi:hypothetical protein WR25_15886 [Diploscapter pachys]|uniref:Uncharacterized protein n=1 Tax=Diploscapter pachys TaxID=2018661 RepID=A0A2A2JJH3_9BILA|nr:hypothetical protein WR25_11127 [Diploscapter pachys]PAV85562.1 hypothetical protein WR25_15886 [Diploscapter pachys]
MHLLRKLAHSTSPLVHPSTNVPDQANQPSSSVTANSSSNVNFKVLFCGGASALHFTADLHNHAKELAQRNAAIDMQLEKDRVVLKKTLKILLLGGPESGKSTIFKQMK